MTVYLHLNFFWLVFLLFFCAFRQKIEYMFANIQTAFDFSSALVLRDHSKWRANIKRRYGWGKILIRHEIINHIAEQIDSVITQVSKKSKLWIHPNLRGPSFSYCRYIKKVFKKKICLRK